MRLESDLLELMLATAKGELADAAPPRFSAEAALVVVMAAERLSRHAGEGRRDRRPRPAEARRQGLPRRHRARRAAGWSPTAAACSASPRAAPTVAEAQRAAYRAVDAIDFPTGFCRRDIGWREIARQG